MKPPILAFGMPRSGTTWIGKILDSHTDTLYRHEPDSWRRLTDIPLFPPLGESSRYEQAVRDYVLALPALCGTKTCGKLPVFRKSYCSEARRQLFRGTLFLAQIAERVYRDFPVIGAPSVRGCRDVRVVWKSIESLGRLGIFLRSLEGAQGVHITRHPCGYIASVMRGEARRMFVDDRPASEDSGFHAQLLTTEGARRRDISLATLNEMTPVERLAWRWVLCNEKAMADNEGSRRYRLLRYEDMCIAPQETAKDLFEWLGLDWSRQTSEFIDASTGREKTAYYSVYKDSKRSVAKWKDELDGTSIDRIRGIVETSAAGRLYNDLWA